MGKPPTVPYGSQERDVFFGKIAVLTSSDELDVVWSAAPIGKPTESWTRGEPWASTTRQADGPLEEEKEEEESVPATLEREDRVNGGSGIGRNSLDTVHTHYTSVPRRGWRRRRASTVRHCQIARKGTNLTKLKHATTQKGD